MAEDHAAVVLARAPVNPSPGIFVAPEVLTAPNDPAADPFPQISQEAQIADRVQHLFWNELQREGLDGEWHLFASNTVGFLDLAKSFDLTILENPEPGLCGTIACLLGSHYDSLGHSSGIPALRRPVKRVVSYRARIFGIL